MSEHPHFTCASCRFNWGVNSFIQFMCLCAFPFVSAERAIALALLIIATEYRPTKGD